MARSRKPDPEREVAPDGRAEGAGGDGIRWPWRVWVVATLAALLSIAPVMRAALETPEGWSFTGNLTVSPDYMQYRTWMRQGADSGPLVENVFTAEPNRPHLPVLFYAAVGTVGELLGVAPEFVFQAAGAIFAFVLVLFLWRLCVHFLGRHRPAWYVFLAIVFGGGLGAYFQVAGAMPWIRGRPTLYRLLVAPTDRAPVFESFRDHYIVSALFDPHFLLLLLVVLSTIVAVYACLQRFTALRLALAMVLGAFAVLLHPYQGVLLACIVVSVGGLFWLKGLHRTAVVKTTAGMFVALGASLALLAFVYSRSGLPAPSWVGTSLPVTILVIGFPIALPLLAIGVNRYWRDADEGSVFLLGWILGCLALSLSGPFFPYPHRGVFTLQVPLFIVAGAIYFRRWRRLTPVAITIAVLAMGLTPVLKVARSLHTGAFDPGAPYRHVNEAHERTLEVLATAAEGDDILLADQPDVLWLAPTYPGRHYAGHFFLTVDYEQKRQRLREFYGASPSEKAEFLRREDIRFLYVSRDTSPRLWETEARPRPTPPIFDSVPGLRTLEANREGTLFEVTPTGQAP